MIKAVVGGGISGLIWSSFNPGYTLISKQIGGQLSDPWMGPRLLHDDKWNRKLLEELHLPIQVETCTIGYYIEGKVQSECPSEYKARYYKKSRCLEGNVEVPSSTMSSGDNQIHHLKVDWNQLVEILHKRSRKIISEEVSSLNSKEVNGIGYDHLVWTPPLPILFKLLGLESPSFSALDKLFIRRENFVDFEIGDYDYVYIPGDEFSYHRVTKVGDEVVVEWTGKDLQNNGGKRCKLLKNAQLIPSGVNPYSLGIPTNIQLLGRMAQWNHKIKIEDVVKQSIS